VTHFIVVCFKDVFGGSSVKMAKIITPETCLSYVKGSGHMLHNVAFVGVT